jgi:hypothetical protein
MQAEAPVASAGVDNREHVTTAIACCRAVNPSTAETGIVPAPLAAASFAAGSTTANSAIPL